MRAKRGWLNIYVDIPFSTASEKQQKMASHPVIDGMDAGMNDYIPKPVSIKDIKEAFKENYEKML